MHQRQIPLILALLLSLPRAAFAAETWILTTADFHSEGVQLRGLDDRGVAVRSLASPNPHTVPLDQLLSLDRAVPLRTQPARFLLRLVGGDRLAGEPGSFNGETFVWRETLIGDVTVPTRSVVSIRRASSPEPSAASVRTDDVVTLSNADTVHGILSDANANGITVQPTAGGDPTVVPLDSIASVELASTATAATTAPIAAGFRIALVDGSILSARSAHSSDDGWTVHAGLADGTGRDLPLSTIQSIEQIDGPVLWLSSLPPSESLQKPFLGTERPARFDRGVTGGPIRFGDHTYTRGIGVHAYSRLSWTIDPAEKSFRTRYAIDGDAPYADVTLRILLDGKTVHERNGFRAGELSPVVQLELNGAHTLTLEVDYGNNDDIQARLNWIEPALLRAAISAK